MSWDAPHDGGERRLTPLAVALAQRIRRDGALTTAQYMNACLHDPGHGYYVRQTAIGAGGDFITAPEISQVFGELIGLWCAVVWTHMQKPPAFNLVEFGPGRGTLMRDALRAMKVVPGLIEAAQVQFIETNPVLQRTQRETLVGVATPVAWPTCLARARDPKLPAILIANEFMDTAPVQQYVRRPQGWLIRVVELDDAGQLAFSEGATCSQAVAGLLERRFPSADLGDIAEIALIDDAFRSALDLPAAMAALVFDYGHEQSSLGDTLQAVRQHRFEHPLCSPGEADLTAQVDFQFLTTACTGPSLAIDGPVTQATFLATLGIAERASRLMAANPGLAGEIEMDVARLIAPQAMGSRFKVMGIRSADLPPLPGFPATSRRPAL